MQNALGKGGKKVNNNNILGVYTVNIDRLVLISPTFHDISGLAVQKHTEHLDSD